MKPKKRRVDIRLKQKLWRRAHGIALVEGITFTEVIERSLEAGLRWYEAKIKRENLELQAPVPPERLKNYMAKMKKLARTRWVNKDDED